MHEQVVPNQYTSLVESWAQDSLSILADVALLRSKIPVNSKQYTKDNNCEETNFVPTEDRAKHFSTTLQESSDIMEKSRIICLNASPRIPVMAIQKRELMSRSESNIPVKTNILFSIPASNESLRNPQEYILKIESTPECRSTQNCLHFNVPQTNPTNQSSPTNLSSKLNSQNQIIFPQQTPAIPRKFSNQPSTNSEQKEGKDPALLPEAPGYTDSVTPNKKFRPYKESEVDAPSDGPASGAGSCQEVLLPRDAHHTCLDCGKAYSTSSNLARHR